MTTGHRKAAFVLASTDQGTMILNRFDYHMLPGDGGGIGIGFNLLDGCACDPDEVRVEVVTVSMQREYVDESPKENALLVAMTNSNMSAEVGGHNASFLHSGDILWMPAGEARKVNDFLGTRSNFLLVSFKDATAAKP